VAILGAGTGLVMAYLAAETLMNPHAQQEMTLLER
jgi:hypothetical protein